MIEPIYSQNYDLWRRWGDSEGLIAIVKVMDDNVPPERRWDLFLHLTEDGDDELFWRVFLYVWPVQGASRYVGERLIEAMAERKPSLPEHLGEYCGEPVAERWRSLPEKLTVFRGAVPGGERGVSWTTRLGVAQSFATQYQDRGIRGVIATATVAKKDILVVFRDKDECEVLIDPRNIRIRTRKATKADAEIGERTRREMKGVAWG